MRDELRVHACIRVEENAAMGYDVDSPRRGGYGMGLYGPSGAHALQQRHERFLRVEKRSDDGGGKSSGHMNHHPPAGRMGKARRG